mmetsp:Transcript_94915/g.277526  ORF Transcript_94915/g.277526 Transcript_94915/m.277526 type:complete len:201 (-) Transcript_94915:892-1494(-)
MDGALNMADGLAGGVHELHDRELRIHGLFHGLVHGHGLPRRAGLLHGRWRHLVPVHPQRLGPRGPSGDAADLPHEERQHQHEVQWPSPERCQERAIGPPDGQQHRRHGLVSNLRHRLEPVVERHGAAGARGRGGRGLEDAERVANLPGGLRQIGRRKDGLRKVERERCFVQSEPHAQQDVAMLPERPQGARDTCRLQFAL